MRIAPMAATGRLIGLFMMFSLFLTGSTCRAQSPSADKRGTVEANVADEWAARTRIKDDVLTAMGKRDFAALNAMATDYRLRRVRTGSGLWALTVFYTSFSNAAYGDDGAGCSREPIDLARAWAHSYPRSPAPIVAQASALADYADCMRGDGYANQVPVDRMRAYRDSAREAYRLLVANKAIAAVDPHYYRTMANLYRSLGLDRAAMGALIGEASRLEPYYYETYLAAAIYFYPQWYGEPGDVGKLADLAARLTDGEGRSAYARVFWYTSACACVYPTAAEWETMKPAMMDVMKFYPSDWNAEGFARVACKMNDVGATARFFSMVKSDSALQWRSQAEHDSCRALGARAG